MYGGLDSADRLFSIALRPPPNPSDTQPDLSKNNHPLRSDDVALEGGQTHLEGGSHLVPDQRDGL